MKTWLFTAAIMVAAPVQGQKASHSDHTDVAAPKVPVLLDGYGSGGFKITTSNPRAQAYFNNGMQLAHAFAHKASVEAMAEAVRLDPQCAMCLWGQALASGPTINFAKTDGEVEELAKLAEKSAALAKVNGTDRERALIEALQLRYKNGGGSKPGDLNFAKAMAALADRYPADDEIAIITADAWLITKAEGSDEWKLNAGLAMPLLERVLKRNPENTGAIHFYIHATEIAQMPSLAERYADRLATLAPNASHLVHMPSHTYYWIGRYEDAARTNMRAVELGIENAKRLGLSPPDGVWGLPYHSHNVTFGLGGALAAGNADIALRLGRPLVARSQVQAEGSTFRQLISSNGYFALAQFADPAEVLALPEPKLPVLKAAWHYARGEALARRNDIEGVRKEAAAIHAPGGVVSRDDGSLAAQIMTYIARNVLVGRAAMMQNRPNEAEIAFAQAAELQESEDFSSLSDPPAWPYPVRRDLAAALLAANDLPAARREAEAALIYRPRDPGTLELLSKVSARAPATTRR